MGECSLHGAFSALKHAGHGSGAVLPQVGLQGTPVAAAEVGMLLPGVGLVQMDMAVDQARQHHPRRRHAFGGQGLGLPQAPLIPGKAHGRQPLLLNLRQGR